MDKSVQRLQLTAWGLAAIVCALAFISWLQHTHLSNITTYDVFPLLGLFAFSLMWTHYMSGVLERFIPARQDALQKFFTITSGIVLGLILAHPLLLEWQLWRDGLGLPPDSVFALYADTAGRGAVILGSVSLMIFLAFEAKRFFGQKSWWKYIEYANVVAMFAILYHAYVLGGEIRGWYQGVWIFYGLSLIAALTYGEINKRRKHE